MKKNKIIKELKELLGALIFGCALWGTLFAAAILSGAIN